MNADPFATLGIAPTFDLPRATLEKQHRELSRTLHPDRYAGAPAGERRQALTRAVDVNEAFRILRDPVTRGEALLGRLGTESGEPEKPAAPEFLMSVMELRESLSTAARDRNTQRVETLSAAVKTTETATLALLTEAFKRLLSKGLEDEEALSTVKQKLGELRYYRRFLAEAASLVDEMD